jgi:riboflavin synthase alpha subunit
VFTGLIREIGRIRGLVPRGKVVRLDVDAPRIAATAGVGDSVAVNGICLTVTAVQARVISLDAAHETRRLSTFDHWRRGDRVHLEPALRAGDPLDGHLVQGHVDGVGVVKELRQAGGSWLLTVELPAALARYLTPKGSVAVDGVSLTVDEGPFTARRFTVNIIPHTMGWTTFDKARPGRRVNLEMDVLVKAARGGAGWTDIPSLAATNDTERPAAGLTLERLLAAGFKGRRSGGPAKGKP